MKIIRGRLKSFGNKPAEFISVKGRIKGVIEKNRGDIFDFTIDIDGRKSIKTFGPEHIDQDLVGQKLAIVDNQYFAIFNADGTIDIEEGANEKLAIKKFKEFNGNTKI